MKGFAFSNITALKSQIFMRYVFGSSSSYIGCARSTSIPKKISVERIQVLSDRMVFETIWFEEEGYMN